VTHFHKLFSPFWLPKGKMLSGFAIRHPGQRRVPLLVYHKNISVRHSIFVYLTATCNSRTIHRFQCCVATAKWLLEGAIHAHCLCC